MEYEGPTNLGPEPKQTFREQLNDLLFPSRPELVAMNLIIFASIAVTIIMLVMKWKGHSP